MQTKICITCKKEKPLSDFGHHNKSKDTRRNKCLECQYGKREDNFNNFVSIANSIHNNKYTYSVETYITTGTRTKVCCPIHGEWWVTPNNHTEKESGCSKCGDVSVSEKLTKSQEAYFDKIKEMHHDTLDLSESVYTGSLRKMTVKCKKRFHGEFTVLPSKLISKGRKGNECPACGNANSYRTRTRYNTDLARLYYIKVNNYFKIGVTIRDVATRYSTKELKGIETLFISDFMPLEDIYGIEASIKRDYKEFLVDKHYGLGYTETFKTDITKGKVSEFFSYVYSEEEELRTLTELFNKHLT